MKRLAAYLFPLWVVGYPCLRYWYDRSQGLIPTEAEWNSAAHSSGPWQADVGMILLFLFLPGCFVQALIAGAFLQHRLRAIAVHWVLGGLFAVGGLGFAFYQFGYLLE